MANFGSSGIDFLNLLAGRNANYSNTVDPRLTPYGHYVTQNSGGDGGQDYQSFQADNPRLGSDGSIIIDGKAYYQVGDSPYVIDPSLNITDPEFGVLSPQSNFRNNDDWLGRNMFGIVAGALGGAVASHAGLFGGGADSGAGSTDVNIPGQMDHLPPTQLNQFGPDFQMDPSLLGGGDLSQMQHLPPSQLNSLGPDFQLDPTGVPVTDHSLTRAPVTDLSTSQNPINGLLSGLGITDPSSLLTVQNALRGAGLLTSVSGLFQRPPGTGNTGGNGNSGGNGDKGGSGQGLSGAPVSRGTYTPNAITQQQLANFHYATPRGR